MVESVSGGFFYGRRAVVIGCILTTDAIADCTLGCDDIRCVPMHQKTVREFAGATETLLTVAVEQLQDIVTWVVSDPGSRAPWSLC